MARREFSSSNRYNERAAHIRGNISRRWRTARARSLRRARFRVEQMAGDISGALSRVFPLIFKILYFAQQIVPIEINPPG